MGNQKGRESVGWDDPSLMCHIFHTIVINEQK